MRNNRRKGLMVLGGGILIAIFCLSQKGYGKNSLTFFDYNSTINEGEVAQQRKVQGDIQRIALHLYRKALDKYKEEQYWKSALDLIVLLDFYPEFSKMDGVIYYLGTSLYEMNMLEGADRLYRYLLKAIPKTRFLPDALLGLQKVYYKKKNYQQSLRFYKALEAHYSKDEIIYESRYYAGQSYYHLSNYILVPEIMSHIDKNSEFYPFGLYTSGLAYLKKKM
jgi:tetratricopeptide (TPR) repeat protein